MQQRFKPVFLIIAHLVMVIGIVLGYNVVFDLITSAADHLTREALSFAAIAKSAFHYVMGLDSYVKLGALFTAAIISYDLVSLYRWITSFRITKTRTCSHCSQKLIREHRQNLDRMLSHLIPLKRYRCLGCSREYLMLDSTDRKRRKLTEEKSSVKARSY